MEGSYQILISNLQVFQNRTALSQISFLYLSRLIVAQLQVNASKENVIRYVV